jgi:hypothetical protein
MRKRKSNAGGAAALDMIPALMPKQQPSDSPATKPLDFALPKTGGYRHQIPTPIDHVSCEDRHDGKPGAKQYSIHRAPFRIAGF